MEQAGGTFTKHSAGPNGSSGQSDVELRNGGAGAAPQPFQPPSISLPKGGGGIRGIGEKFAANPVTGTGSLAVPIAVSPGRSGFGPQLTLSYDSGSGNGPFGFGWGLSVPAITRKTDKGLPQYRDAVESDVFILSGAEDLVPVLVDGSNQRYSSTRTLPDSSTWNVNRYRPRIEGLFARIERWTNQENGAVHWRSITRDNVTTLYGETEDSRVADPTDSARVFSWLICASYDDKGNAIVYEYKKENSDGVDLAQAHEQNRTPLSRSANRHLKRIKYGNRMSRLIQPDLAQTEWMFEVVFDYGEHDHSDPKPEDTNEWLCRHDPFSSYRAGFEVRTYRLCQRVLMFHHFPKEQGVGQDCLVRSTDFTYRDIRQEPEDLRKGHPVASFIASVAQSGYKRQTGGGYLEKSLPPLEFEYSQPIIQEDVREIDQESLENLPYGLDGSTYQWVDLDGEGVSGILTEQGAGWFYKSNLGQGRFGPAAQVPRRPSLAGISSGQQQFLDLSGDGQLDLVDFGGPTPGFFERTKDEDWETSRPFKSLPNIRWDQPNLRFVDLDGDGHADVLITENEVFTWYPSLAEDGFAPAERVHQATDEEKGPRLIFADGTQSIFLSDMSGDGLTDLVRIRNGEVSYWPNVGYGRFGPRVAMDNAPWFDAPDVFDQRRLRIADIDGSGNTDIIYLGGDGVRLYFNQSGNGWSEPKYLCDFPPIDSVANVTAVDLLGNGTACLVWSSPLPGNARRPMRYIDLMGGQKPHLLQTTRNNLGAETRVHYASSTKFCLADKAAGKPWITRLPFPVHVVERVETFDRISHNRFVTRYAYHHGFFDGVEREFRGFGMVEQFDTEAFATLSENGMLPDAINLDESSHVPPVLTKTWFHTGVFIDREHVSNFFAGLLDVNDRGEYFREPGLSDAQARALLLPDTVLPEGLSAEEEREACRALKGSILRQEIYALDGSNKQEIPYTVSERNYAVKVLQQRAGNRHAVFFTHARETIDFHYERNPNDPRISHALTLEVDDFGNVAKSAAIGYGRRQPDVSLSTEDQAKQTQTLITYTENSYTNAIGTEEAYRTPLPCESRTYELTGYAPSGSAERFQASDFVQQGEDGISHIFDSEVKYEESSGNGRQRRLIENVRTYYRADDLGAAQGSPLALLPLGQLEPLAVLGETYKLAYTPGLLSRVYQRTRQGQPLENLLPTPASVLAADIAGDQVADRGGYVNLDGDGHWWVPSGRAFHSPGKGDDAAAELANARQHFFLPRRYRDPFGQTAVVAYDAYDVLLLETRDPLDNRVTIGERDSAGNLTAQGNDYRVLQPRLIMDPNRNRASVAFDVLGMVVGTAVMGKPEENLGDSLEGFEPDLSEADTLDHLSQPLADPHAVLGRATTRLIYDLDAYRRTRNAEQPKPPVVYTVVRETHDAYLAPRQLTKVQHSFSYSDGFGREIQKKIQAEPGPLTDGGDVITPRWVGSGWTIFNNKGKPVRQYEPFFAATHDFELARIVGVSPVLFYDAPERVIATLHPNHTYEKVVFDPWSQTTADVNDTVASDPRSDNDTAGYVTGFFATQPQNWQTWHAARISGGLGAPERAAANKAAAHADTPTVASFDTLGRTFLTDVDNGPDGSGSPQKYRTRVELDIEGNQRAVTDTLGRVVVRYDYDMLGNRIHQASMEAGERWTLIDVTGKPIRAWDSREHQIRTAYDPLRRPADTFLLEVGASERLVGRTVYGDGQPDADSGNLRNQVAQLFDQAGIVTNEAYDFKGNLLRSGRQLSQEYKATLDWAIDVPLEAERYASSTRFDALNRPIELTTPDNSVIRPAYNEANLLERLDANLRGAATETPFVQNIDYGARGQRTLIEYGNGVRTIYAYDPETFRLTHMRTLRGTEALQDLSYTYDPVGNITHIRDDAQQTIFFRNRRVDPSTEYTYDAIYRLIEATGREHLGQTGAHFNPPTPPDAFNAFHSRLEHPGDGNAMGRYVEQYVYDAVGNILAMQHRGSDPAHPGWTRSYAYSETSQLEAGNRNNRLSQTTIGATSETYRYDGLAGLHGNITAMPHLPLMQWDFEDQLKATAQQVVGDGGTPETTWYVYGADGKRIRKVTERQVAAGQTPTRVRERVYTGNFEAYREYGHDGVSVSLERETLHIMDDKQRRASVETRTKGDEPDVPEQLITYQLVNHLGSACLELDDHAQVVSYEEFTPYGTSTYQAVRSQTGPPKRYRYTGKERDEESSLYHHQFRYYAPWLGRWSSCDPIGIDDHIDLYVYTRNSPTNATDPYGLWSWRTVAVVAAAVTVGVVVTVATAGAAAPIAAAAVASIGLTGTAATVATGVAVGAVAGAAGGFAAGAAGETTRQVAHGEDLDAGRILSEAGQGAAVGAAVGAAIPLATAAAGAAASTTAGAAVIGAARTAGGRVAASAVGRGAAAVGRSVAAAGTRAASTTGGRVVTHAARAVTRGLRQVHSASERFGQRLAARLPGRVGEHARYTQAGERISRRLAEGPSGGGRTAAAAEVDVAGYTGNPSPRALSASRATPGHSPVPADEARTLSTYRVGQVETRGSPRMADWKFSPNPGQGHGGARALDAEIKVLEQIQPNLPPNAQGTIHLGATRPTCPSCTTAMFEFQANNPGIRLVLHSPSIPAPTVP